MIDAIERGTLPIEIVCKIRIGKPGGIIREVDLMESSEVDGLSQMIKEKAVNELQKKIKVIQPL